MTAGPPRRRVIALTGGEVTALEFGPASRRLDVLFLHANGFNALAYRQSLAPLASELRILAVDLRGHGRNRLETQVEGHSWQIYATDLLATLQALGETPRVLSGHSMGATSILLAAKALADGDTKFVLFDPVLMPRDVYLPAKQAPHWDFSLARGALRRKEEFSSRDEAFQLYRGRGAFRTWPDAMLRDYLEDGLMPAADGTVRLSCARNWEALNFAHFCMADPYPALDGSGPPIHILRAEQESTCQFARAAGNDRIKIDTIPGTTHFLPMERPDLVKEALLVAASFSLSPRGRGSG